MEPLYSNCRRFAPAKEPRLVEVFLLAANAACTIARANSSIRVTVFGSRLGGLMDCSASCLRQASIGGML